MIERGGFEKCVNTVQCSLFLSVFLILLWAQTVVPSTIRSEWRHDMHLSIEKIATMHGMDLRRGTQGVPMMLTVICGIFLFTVMTEEETIDKTAIFVVGSVGLLAALGSFFAEALISFRVHNRMLIFSESGQIEETTAKEEIIVEECSWIFVIPPFIATSTTSILCALGKWELGMILIPTGIYSSVLSVFAKPKRTDVGYRIFHFLHLISASAINFFGAIYQFKRGNNLTAGASLLFGYLLTCLLIKCLLYFRQIAAELPERELSG